LDKGSTLAEFVKGLESLCSTGLFPGAAVHGNFWIPQIKMTFLFSALTNLTKHFISLLLT
jgi:hypothetical protein